MGIVRHKWVRPARRTVVVLAGALLAGSLAACATTSSGSGNDSAGQYGFKEATQKDGSAITVWVDASRVAASDAFKKAHPDVKINVVTYDGSANGSGSFKTKMGLYDRAGSGWPDVVFSTQNNDAAWASQASGRNQPFAATLDKGLVPDSTLKGFTPGSLDPCTVDGKVYCLRNDLAQVVLWYDKSLMDSFGYSVPTTWQEYQQLGQKVAAEHPGYTIGSVGDPWAPEIYMWGSKCQANDITGPRELTINTDTDQCKRAASLIDAGVANKSMTNLSVFSPEFVKTYANKVLMMPGPAWFAGAIFDNKESLNLPAGHLGVAKPLGWGDGDTVTGDVGGGTWFVSSHSANLKAAEQFAEFVTTADDYQVDLAPDYPAFASAGQKWLAKQSTGGYYATDLSALTDAAQQVWTGWGSGEFSQEAIWAKTIAPVITSGGKVADSLGTWQTAIENQAKVAGYSVK